MLLKVVKRYLLVVLTLLLRLNSVVIAQKDSVSVLKSVPKYAIEIGLTMSLLEKHHYLKIPLNDSLSKIIYNNYLSSLDNNRIYFTQSDINYLNKYETILDDDLRKQNADVAFHIFRIFRERSNTRIDYALTLIDRGFDYSKKEELNTSTENIPWVETEEKIKEKWSKIVKSQALNLKLSGNDDDEISKTLTKRYNQQRKSINQYNSDDVFQFYMNAVTSSYDPHTNYFSPISTENFNINMNLSLEGIGARLSQNKGYTIINEVIAGGPAYKSKVLQTDDKIVAVAQGEDDYVDVVGWRLQDVVQLIRGPKGSVVRLHILKENGSAGGSINEVRLVRDKIKLEEQSAKVEMIPISKGRKIFNLGVITLPSFYMNFEDSRNGVKDYRSASRDVKKLIEELKAQEVDGILVDLRYNGGGSLPEAINLTGLFIDQGPVVQVRHNNQRIEIQRNQNVGVVYGGPLAVLVNRFSASASEIFSAAIQDYKRGVIIGETTFGKGSVQQMTGFNRYYPSYPERMGNLKFTLSKYYRINGSSTQNIGVTPDIHFPSVLNAEDFGESSKPNSLKWDQIASSYFVTINTISDKMIKNLNVLFENDLKIDIDLRNMQEGIERIKEYRNKSSISLNYEQRKIEEDKEKKEEDLQIKLSESAGKINTEFSISEEKRKKVSQDPYLKESLRLLAELTK